MTLRYHTLNEFTRHIAFNMVDHGHGRKHSRAFFGPCGIHFNPGTRKDPVLEPDDDVHQ